MECSPDSLLTRILMSLIVSTSFTVESKLKSKCYGNYLSKTIIGEFIDRLASARRYTKSQASPELNAHTVAPHFNFSSISR